MCIINHTYKFIFIHIPKSAGTTITKFYSSYSTYQDLEIGGTPLGEAIQPYYYKRFGIRKHSSYDEIFKVIGIEKTKKYFTFAFVRNPYKRFVSSFKFLHQWKNGPGYEKIKHYQDINEFISSSTLSNTNFDSIFMPQTYWVGSNNINDKYEIKVNYIGKIENIKLNILEINKLVGFDNNLLDFDLPVKNKSKIICTSNFILKLNSKSIKIINTLYEKDFSLFNYEMI